MFRCETPAYPSRHSADEAGSRDVSTRNPTTPEGWSAPPNDAASIRHHRRTPLQNQRASARIRGAITDRATELAGTSSEPPQAGPKGEAQDGPSNWRSERPPLPRRLATAERGEQSLHLYRPRHAHRPPATPENARKTVICGGSRKRSRRPVTSLPLDAQGIDLQRAAEGQGMGSEAPEALHLSRLTVASVTARRYIRHARALHLSAEVPISFTRSVTSRPLL
jgi:hypothetical protein